MTARAELWMPRTHEEPLPRSSHNEGRRGWVIGLFAIYLALLVWIVLWKLQVPHIGEGAVRHVKLVPFVPTADDGASAPLEVVANVVLFIPFGVYLGLVAPALPWWNLATLVAASSLGLEVAQYVLAVGRSDSTDLIANTAGGLAGLGLLAVMRRRLGHRAAAVMTRACAIGTALLLLAAGAFIASPLHYAPLRDVPPSSSGDSGPPGRAS